MKIVTNINHVLLDDESIISSEEEDKNSFLSNEFPKIEITENELRNIALDNFLKKDDKERAQDATGY